MVSYLFFHSPAHSSGRKRQTASSTSEEKDRIHEGETPEFFLPKTVGGEDRKAARKEFEQLARWISGWLYYKDSRLDVSTRGVGR